MPPALLSGPWHMQRVDVNLDRPCPEKQLCACPLWECDTTLRWPACVNPLGARVTPSLPSAAAGSSSCLSPGDNHQSPQEYASRCSLERLSPRATPHFLLGCSPPLRLACSVFLHHCAPHTICLLLACPQLRGSEPWTGLTGPTWASPQQPCFSEA